MEPFDVKDLEELFQDRFTEKDSTYTEIKSKKCPPPAVIYPWKNAAKILNKRWDYSSGRQDQGRSRYDHERSNSQHSYRDRSSDNRQRGRYKDRDDSTSHNRDDSNHSRDQHRYNDRNRY